ncbi:hypothetical protein FRC12_002614 [Ceratobasidium sp. 428]|nr:hypothetical protein FRC12_002614 [Ceratobasidium sp. 428]
MVPQQASAVPKRFISVEYHSHQVAVRRSANYDTMLSLVKEAFRSLRSVETERISISAFVEELGDTLEVSKNIWSELLPELTHVTITLDSSPPVVEESESEPELEEDSADNNGTDDDDHPETSDAEDIAPGADAVKDENQDDDSDFDFPFAELARDRKAPRPTLKPLMPSPTPSETSSENHEPIVHRRLIKPRSNRCSTPIPVPSTLPDQADYRKSAEENTITVFYYHANRSTMRSVFILTKPSTTILDLQEYAARLCTFKGFIISYMFRGKTFDHLTHVSELGGGDKTIEVKMED